MNQPLKVALVSPYDFASPGGVTTHIQNLSVNLEQRGVFTRVFAPVSAMSHNSISNLIPMGVPVSIPIGGSIARISLSVWLAGRLRKSIETENFDIVHVHEPFAGALTLAVLAKQLQNNPLMVATFHSFEGSGLYQIVPNKLLNKYFGKIDGKIAVSSAARSYVSKYLPADYDIIPNGINTDEILMATPFQNLLDDKVNILFVGRLEKRKGLKYLLASYCDLKWKFPNIRLIIVGAGKMDVESQRILGERNPEDVFIAGSVTHEEKLKYFKTADIFCTPATGQESFGIVLLEAMSAELPIVASGIDGYRSVLDEKEGLFTNIKDSHDLSEKLSRLIANKKMRIQMGKNGREKSKLFSWSIVTDKIMDHYLSLLSLRKTDHIRCID
ncbi:MAG: glycosyltransferase family 4 protein [SAR202 cluster bacterium]|jgi:phosphatidylinositol alpha-mannosyltransferase|nr:glycosyltransferase family 4 protein [SAR202 cluster bacterium]HJO59576.1 glycosyltransferase family 4 protein [SAR202 cluster bacterium]|tara:strand:- start:582 stop:1736 length:1155 start_codon:yes stop_codon:yes gene_type:complete